VYIGASGVLTGSARLTQQAQAKAARLVRQQDVDLRRTVLERKRTTLEAQIAVLRAEFAVAEVASLKVSGQEEAEQAQLEEDAVDMALSRKADVPVAVDERSSK